MSGLSRVERRKQETKKRILDICEQLFIFEKNYNTVTMREIARRVGVSTGALYLHFHSKEEILTTLFLDFLNTQFTGLADRLDAEPDGKKKILILFDFFQDMTHEPRTTLFIQIPLDFGLCNPKNLRKSSFDKLQESYDRVLDIVSGAFAAAMRDGSITGKMEPKLLSITLLTTYFSLFRTFIAETGFNVDRTSFRDYTLNDIYDTFRSTFLNGIFIQKVNNEIVR